MTPGGDPLEARRIGDTQLVALSGEIDLGNAAGLGERIAALLGDSSALVVDLGGVTYFDSSGMRMLDGLVGATEAAGVALRVVAPEAGRARFVLRLCAWPEHLLCETVDGAVAAVAAR